MSRIGKKPVALPKGVTAEIKGQTIEVKGPKGTRSFTCTKANRKPTRVPVALTSSPITSVLVMIV